MKWYILYLHLVELGSRTTSNFLDTKRSKFLLLFLKCLEKLCLVLITQLVCLQSSLFKSHVSASCADIVHIHPSLSSNRLQIARLMLPISFISVDDDGWMWMHNGWMAHHVWWWLGKRVDSRYKAVFPSSAWLGPVRHIHTLSICGV